MEPSEKIIAWGNRFNEFGTQQIEGVECVSTPFPLINEVSNKVNLDLTAQQLRELLSSIQVGAEWAYPDKSHQILFNFWKGIVCAPVLEADGDCVEYPSISPFITYKPNNPLSSEVPSGYLMRPWVQFGEFDTIFPDWVDNWIQGQIEYFTGYQASDVLCNIASLPINSIDAFLDNGNVLPTIEVRFSGTGVVEIELLSFPLGGKAIVELDNHPNLIDYLTSGIIDPASFVVELNRDVLSFPPDEYPINNVEIKVETGGPHVLYIVFVPNLDDSLTPIGLGGGLRSIELCGFQEAGTSMGIEQIFWDGCELKKVVAGVTSTVVTAEQIEACLTIPSSGGGGGLIVNGATYNKAISSQNFTGSSFAAIANSGQVHGFVKENALIGVSATVTNSGNNDTFIKPVIVNGGVRKVGNGLTAARGLGTSNRELWAWDYFSGINLSGTNEIFIDGKVSAGTGTLGGGYDLQYVIIEVDDFSDIFVEDIRIFEGQLQKKIAGIWIDVSDSFEAIINGLQSQVNAAAVNAAAAIVNAQNAVNLANSAIAVNNTQNTRLTNIETMNTTQNGRLDDLELDAAAQAVTLNDHDARIDALEAALAGTEIWQSYVKDFRTSAGNWTVSGGTWVSGQGFVASSDGLPITISYPANWVSQREAYIVVDFRIIGGNTEEMLINFLGLSADSNPIVFAGNADLTLTRVIARVPTITSPQSGVNIRFEPLDQDGFVRIERVQFVGLATIFSDGD